VVGTDKSDDAPPGVSDFTVAVPRGRRRPADDPLRVLRASRSAPIDVVASLVRHPLHAVSTATRCSVDRPPYDPKAARHFHRLRRPLRVRATMPSPALPGWIAPPGVSCPSSDLVRRDPYHPGMPRPARSALGVSRPRDGLLPLRTRGHARPAAAPGVPTCKVLSNGKAETRCRVCCTLSLVVRSNLEL